MVMTISMVIPVQVLLAALRMAKEQNLGFPLLLLPGSLSPPSRTPCRCCHPRWSLPGGSGRSGHFRLDCAEPSSAGSTRSDEDKGDDGHQTGQRITFKLKGKRWCH